MRVTQVVLALVVPLALQQPADDPMTRFTGAVHDDAGQPLAGVHVRLDGVDADVSNARTDAEGRFRLSVRILAAASTEARLNFELPGFESAVRTVALGNPLIELGDVQLQRAAARPTRVSEPVAEDAAEAATTEEVPADVTAAPGVAVTRTDFDRGVSIKGRVSGLDADSYNDYKIVAYVLTDKWYIHPFAGNTEGSSYATINGDGTWTLSTVWRGYQATHLALLLVPRKVWAPPQVEADVQRPEVSLVRAVQGVKAYVVEEAPEGI